MMYNKMIAQGWYDAAGDYLELEHEWKGRGY